MVVGVLQGGSKGTQFSWLRRRCFCMFQPSYSLQGLFRNTVRLFILYFEIYPIDWKTVHDSSVP